METAGINGGVAFVSPCHFSFFDDGKQAKIAPSYLLFPNVRMADLHLSLAMIRAKNRDYPKLKQARQHNVEQGQRSPFGVRQRSFKHMINRFHQGKAELWDAARERLEEEKKEALKGVFRRIMALTQKAGGILTLEEKAELTELRGLLNPSLKVREAEAREAFKAAWKGIQADSTQAEATTSEG